MWVGLLTNSITNKLEKKSDLINAHAPSRKPVPLSPIISIHGCSPDCSPYVSFGTSWENLLNLNVKRFHLKWSFHLFSWPHLVKQWYCKEKLHACHLGLINNGLIKPFTHKSAQYWRNAFEFVTLNLFHTSLILRNLNRYN